MNHGQEAALEKALACAGAYLNELGEFDLSKLTPEQATEFGRIIVCRYSEQSRLGAILDDDIPY
jgi:hypothetical protein